MKSKEPLSLKNRGSVEFEYGPGPKFNPTYNDAPISCTISGSPQAAHEIHAWACIGMIASASGVIDQVLDNMIWKLAGIIAEFGACITSQFSSNHNRFVSLEALSREHGVEVKTLERLSKLSKKWKDLGERRNRAVHDPLAWNADLQEMCILRMVTRPQQDLIYDVVPFDLKKAYDTSVRLREFYNEIVSFRADLFAELQPFFEKSASPLVAESQKGSPPDQAKKRLTRPRRPRSSPQ